MNDIEVDLVTLSTNGPECRVQVLLSFPVEVEVERQSLGLGGDFFTKLMQALPGSDARKLLQEITRRLR